MLDKTCLTNIITNTEFNDNNIKKLKELEKNNVENEVIHTLYLEYNKDNSILTLTLIEENGIQEYRKRYKLYVKEDTIKYLFNISIEEPVERKQVIDVDHLSSNLDEDADNKTIKKEESIGRNDDCPCGSGKKYKKCCGR